MGAQDIEIIYKFKKLSGKKMDNPSTNFKSIFMQKYLEATITSRPASMGPQNSSTARGTISNDLDLWKKPVPFPINSPPARV